MQTIPLAELRAQLGEKIRALRAGAEPVIISERGRPVAVLLSLERYEQITRPPYDYGAALDAWRAGHAVGIGDGADDSWAHDLRDPDPAGGRASVAFGE